MKRALIVVDMQNDFVSGVLGTAEARAVEANVVKTILDFDGSIYFTLDTHEEDYLTTQEGERLPVKHCIARKRSAAAISPSGCMTIWAATSMRSFSSAYARISA